MPAQQTGCELTRSSTPTRRSCTGVRHWGSAEPCDVQSAQEAVQTSPLRLVGRRSMLHIRSRLPLCREMQTGRGLEQWGTPRKLTGADAAPDDLGDLLDDVGDHVQLADLRQARDDVADAARRGRHGSSEVAYRGLTSSNCSFVDARSDGTTRTQRGMHEWGECRGWCSGAHQDRYAQKNAVPIRQLSARHTVSL